MPNRFLATLAAIFLLSFMVAAQSPSAPPAAEAGQSGGVDDTGIYGLTRLHQISMTVSPAEWSVLQTSVGRGAGAGEPGKDYTQADGRLTHVGSGFRGYYPWVHADLRLGGVEVKDAGLRYRGNFSFTSSSAANPLRANFKVKTDLFGGKASWNGTETLNFNAAVLDSSLMREVMAFALFRAAGVPASRTAYAEIRFNVPSLYENTSGGLYILIENVNKQFLRQALPPGTGLLFKPEGLRGGIQSQGDNWAAYIPVFRPEREATPEEQRRVIEFANLISQPDAALFRARIGAYLDVDEFLRFIAVHAFIVNTDSYLANYHNYYLYLDPKDDKFRFIPWDEDLSMGARGNSLDMMRPVTGPHPLVTRLLEDPAVVEQYRAIVKELAGVFTRPALEKMVNDLEQRVGAGRGSALRSFIEARISHIQSVAAQ